MENLNTENIESELFLFNNLKNDIGDLINNIDTNNNLIELNQLVIKLEKELKKFPPQAIGSVYYYNQLNEKYDLFDDKNKFNKIIRFLDHIENKEKKYRELYLECTKNYFNNTTCNNIPLIELIQEQKEINNGYHLLLILTNEVNGDIVNFNKVYNKLEDAGLFMTVPEKSTQKYLSDISSKLDNVLLGLETLFQSLEETNRSLREIEGNTSDLSYEISDLSKQLWDISFKFNNK